MSDEQQGAAPAAEQSAVKPVVAEAPKEVLDLDEAPEQEAPKADAKPEPTEGQQEEHEADGEEDEPEAGTEEKPRKLSRFQRERRAKLRAQERAEFAEREAERLRRQVEERQGQPEQPRRTEAAIDPNDPEPKEKDYPDYFAFRDEHVLWRARQETQRTLQTAEQRRQEQAQRESNERTVAETKQRLDKIGKAAADKYEDFYEAVEGMERLSPVLQAVLVESDKAGDVIYALANDPDKLSEFNRMQPVAAMRAVLRLEDQLSQRKPNNVTKAPPPLKPLNGGGSAPPKDIRSLADPEDITGYAKARDAQRKARA